MIVEPEKEAPSTKSCEKNRKKRRKELLKKQENLKLFNTAKLKTIYCIK